MPDLALASPQHLHRNRILENLYGRLFRPRAMVPPPLSSCFLYPPPTTSSVGEVVSETPRTSHTGGCSSVGAAVLLLPMSTPSTSSAGKCGGPRHGVPVPVLKRVSVLAVLVDACRPQGSATAPAPSTTTPGSTTTASTRVPAPPAPGAKEQQVVTEALVLVEDALEREDKRWG